MDTKLIKSLVAYGLTENEAKIYISILRKLEASVFEIAKDTGIPRATVYITLEKMKDLKIISSLKKNNVLYYTPENPSRLKVLAEEKERIIADLLPELNAIIDTDQEKPSVKMYTGAEGVKIALEDILETMKKENSHVLLAASRSEITKLFPKYFPEWLKRREALGIRTKLILPETEKQVSVFQENALREIRYLPETFEFKATIHIYENKMAVFNLKEGEIYSMVIESEPIVETFSKFFSFAWENTKK